MDDRNAAAPQVRGEEKTTILGEGQSGGPAKVWLAMKRQIFRDLDGGSERRSRARETSGATSFGISTSACFQG